MSSAVATAAQIPTPAATRMLSAVALLGKATNNNTIADAIHPGATAMSVRSGTESPRIKNNASNSPVAATTTAIGRPQTKPK